MFPLWLKIMMIHLHIIANQTKYVFRTLYKSTQAAALQESAKNKFQLKGRFKSTGWRRNFNWGF
jgi:cell surface protein SprA